MNKTMFAAMLSIGVLLFGVIATTYQMVPDADAVKAKGTYLKDIRLSLKHTSSKVCGDQLCEGLNDASTGLRKGQISRGFSR
ncbi:MAG: hypothetical protein ACT4OD_01465 [Candidatus Nitrosotenuis sp.]